MRKVAVQNGGSQFVIYIGDISPSGKYEVLKLSEAEAAVLAEKLQAALRR